MFVPDGSTGGSGTPCFDHRDSLTAEGVTAAKSISARGALASATVHQPPHSLVCWGIGNTPDVPTSL